MTHLLSLGRHQLFRTPGHDLVSTPGVWALMATVFRGPDPVVTIGVATDDDSAAVLWEMLTDLRDRLPGAPGIGGEVPRMRPDETPWCVVVLANVTREESSWLGDFERCLAWAWIEHVRSQGGR